MLPARLPPAPSAWLAIGLGVLTWAALFLLGLAGYNALTTLIRMVWP